MAKQARTTKKLKPRHRAKKTWQDGKVVKRRGAVPRPLDEAKKDNHAARHAAKKAAAALAAKAEAERVEAEQLAEGGQ
jgi:phage FluMu gp28-like protein